MKTSVFTETVPDVGPDACHLSVEVDPASGLVTLQGVPASSQKPVGVEDKLPITPAFPQAVAVRDGAEAAPPPTIA